MLSFRLTRLGCICWSVLLLCLALLLLTEPVTAKSWYIEPDGTGDAPSIKAGIDSAAAGDTVIVACGTYYEARIDIKSGVVLMSESGEAPCVTIDADRADIVFWCHSCDSTTVIRGFTITNGVDTRGVPPGRAGGMVCEFSSLLVENCDFVGNGAVGWGGGVLCAYCSPHFKRCTFSSNEASYGGGVLLEGASPIIENCVFASNDAGSGGGLCCGAGCDPEILGCTFYGNVGRHGGGGIHCLELTMAIIQNTIIAYSPSGAAVVFEEDFLIPILSCCDLYGNADGDWVGCVADQCGLRGNFSACPSFCDTEIGDFHLCDESPCLPGNHPHGYECGLIGALGEGCTCGPSSARSATWGSIKASYK